MLTKSLWKECRLLIDQYNGLMYNELKTVLSKIHVAQNILRHLYDSEDFNILEKFKAIKIAKKIANCYGRDAQKKLKKSLENFETDFQGKFFTKTRGELSVEEYIQYINKMMREDYMTNLTRYCRNPE